MDRVMLSGIFKTPALAAVLKQIGFKAPANAGVCCLNIVVRNCGVNLFVHQ
jgi:hypothetical protein